MGARWLLLIGSSIALVSCVGEHGQVDLTPGTDFSQYDKVHITFEEIWMANHSIVQVLIQELERRHILAVLGEPTEESSTSMILHLQNSETTQKSLQLKIPSIPAIPGLPSKEEPTEPVIGNTEKLSSIEFLVLDQETDQQIAFISYTGRNLDRLEQKIVVRRVADRIFGKR